MLLKVYFTECKIIKLKIKKSIKQSIIILRRGMEKLITFLLASIVLGAVIFAQKKEKTIVIIVKPQIQPKDSSLFIVGNLPALGNWNPSAAPMKKQENGSWKFELTAPEGYELEFKFTRGSWGAEAARNDGAIPGNCHLKVSADTVFEMTIENWKDNFIKPQNYQVTGTVEYLKHIEGKGIKPRDVAIWLPPDYYKNKKKKYPVLYMHDGQNVFDPATSSFGVDWQADETADSLIRQNRMKGIIIAAIYNTADRNDEYSYTKTGRAYMEFIVKTLKPKIDLKYRTMKDRKNTAVMGSSMGGLISLMLVWEHNDVFSMAGCLSPAFKVDEYNYLPYIEKYKGKKKNIKLYIDDGGKGLEMKLLPGVAETIELLNKKGYETGKDLMWYYDEEAGHTESAWAARLWRPMLFMFGR
jgi:predicted alpha/beta superfamily hydrolase